MNNVKIVDHTNLKLLKKRHKQIVDIWGGPHKFSFKYPDKCVIAYIDGFKGGVQIELVEGVYSLVYFAGFEEKDRRKGFLTRCVNALKDKYNLVGTQVDMMDNLEPWHKLGFTTQVMVNFCPTYINISKEEWKKLNSKAGQELTDGISINDLIAMAQS